MDKVDHSEKRLRIHLYIGVAIVGVAALVLALVLLGATQTVDSNISMLYNARDAASDYALADLEVTHGEDYVIQWEETSSLTVFAS